MNQKPEFLFTAKAPSNLDKYIGRTVSIPEFMEIDGKKVKVGETPVRIATICGNIGMTLGHAEARPTYYEINGQYLIGMLRFHAQMNRSNDFTEEDFQNFENMQFDAKKLSDDKAALNG